MAVILLVDDDQLVRGTIADAVRYAGHLVIEASDGRVALELFRSHRPDIVITDLVMPVMDGAEMIWSIRTQWSAAKIIAMTGHGWDAECAILKEASRLGANATLKKPFSLRELLDVVEQYVPIAN